MQYSRQPGPCAADLLMPTFAGVAAAYAPQAAQGEVLRQHTLSLVGVVVGAPRSHSAKTGFAMLAPAPEAALAGDDTQLQLVMNVKFAPEGPLREAFVASWRALGAGDLVRVEGHPGKTRSGKIADGFSLFACSFAILRMTPDADRALRILSGLPGGEPLLDRKPYVVPGSGAAAGMAVAAPEPELLELPELEEARRLLCSMLAPEHGTQAVLSLLRSLAAPRIAIRLQEDALAAAGTLAKGEQQQAAAAAAAAAAADAACAAGLGAVAAGAGAAAALGVAPARAAAC